MKEYNIKINLVVEAQDSDYDRVEQYAQELVEALIQDDNITYDDDIEIIEVSVDDVHNISEYNADPDYDMNEGDDDENY